MEDNYKEVYFNIYCETCKYEYQKEDKDPCDECLTNPVNLESHRPVKWEEK